MVIDAKLPSSLKIKTIGNDSDISKNFMSWLHFIGSPQSVMV